MCLLLSRELQAVVETLWNTAGSEALLLMCSFSAMTLSNFDRTLMERSLGEGEGSCFGFYFSLLQTL